MGPGGTRDRGDAAPIVIVAAIGVAVAVAVLHGIAHDLGTAGSLSSILALPIMVGVFYAARRLHRKMRQARIAALRQEDRRNRSHVISTLNMCRSLVLGAQRADPGSPAAMSAMRDTAHHIGDARTAHEHLLTRHGMHLAEKVRNMALDAIEAQSCSPADLIYILSALRRLDEEILDIDSDALAKRREREAGAGGPAAE